MNTTYRYNESAWMAMLGDGRKQAAGRRAKQSKRNRLLRKACYQLAANTGRIDRSGLAI